MFCTQCGIQLPAAARYCPRCGMQAALVPPDLPPGTPHVPTSASADITRPAEVDALQRINRPAPSGVGGWLLVLALCFLVLTPTLLIFISTGYVNNQQIVKGSLDTADDWNLAWLLMWVVNLPLALWSMEAGRMLLTQTGAPTVLYARNALWSVGPASAVLNFLVLTWLAGYDQQLLYMAIIGIAVSLVQALAWHTYLHRSLRVPETYLSGRPLTHERRLSRLCAAGYAVVALTIAASIWSTRLREDAWMARVPGDWRAESTDRAFNDHFYEASSIEWSGTTHRVVAVATPRGMLAGLQSEWLMKTFWDTAAWRFAPTVQIQRVEVDCSTLSYRAIAPATILGPLFVSHDPPYYMSSEHVSASILSEVCR